MNHEELIHTLHYGADPYSGFLARRFKAEVTGWNSQHAYLAKTILEVKPSVVIEVGVWKGGSTLHMAKVVKTLGLEATIIAIDTWLGSSEHWLDQKWFDELLLQNGYPSLYYTFLANVVNADLSDCIVPLPLDSTNAAVLLKRKRIGAQVIHIDGGHDYETVTSDLRRWWPVLEPGGVMIMDDYDQNGKAWPGVKKASDEFLAETPHLNFEALPMKCRFAKPQRTDT